MCLDLWLVSRYDFYEYIICQQFLVNIMNIYLATKVFRLVGNAAHDNRKTRIIPRHMLLVIRINEELEKLHAGVTIAHGGVLLDINHVLLFMKTKKCCNCYQDII
ncbi:putative transcription factor Hap3/NF-YB family [Medicago truncatula]|uniref:Histone H2A n=1 Tax=Medicago truncatula TaxID=3880 RepID=A0A396JUV4_MEDTR|nr:putative transcription factor Hap3/NF-YB family [Medicago truncatula]